MFDFGLPSLLPFTREREIAGKNRTSFYNRKPICFVTLVGYFHYEFMMQVTIYG